MSDINEFDVLSVELEGKNAIEASAGTGKTFSIAVLVLRLLLEKKIPIEEILMVTFTNAAVAELSERIRLFVREAFSYVKTGSTNEQIVATIVDRANENAKKKKEVSDVEFLLKKAVAFLDETSICTIHSFCQRTLSEFAFETGSIFEATVITDEAEIINNSIYKYWRKNITPLDKEVLDVLSEAGLSLDTLKTVVKESLNDKKFAMPEKVTFEDAKHSIDNLRSLEDSELELLKENKADFLSFKLTEKQERDFNDFINGISSSTPFMTQAGEINKTLMKKIGEDHPIIEFYEELLEVRKNYNTNLSNYLYTYYDKAIDSCKSAIEEYKTRFSIITQNDFINNLYNVVQSDESGNIASSLQKKYQAFFIDEFQDTDPKQYEIFTKLFPNTISFYIGDPKQSIYGFRGADLDSYQKAIDSVEINKKFTMTQNFRANQQVVDAMNKFFKTSNPFLDSNIGYIEVTAGKKNMPTLTKDGEDDKPFTILQIEKGEKEADIVARQISELLNSDYKIGEEKLTLEKFSIGVIVKKKYQGRDVKNALRGYGINSVLINEAKVIESEAVEEFLFFLESVIDPSPQNIKKVLLTSFVGRTPESLSRISPDDLIKQIEFFRKQTAVYSENGIFVMCQNILNFFNLKKRLLEQNMQRELSNITQFIEILNKKEKQGSSSIEELVSWAKKVKNGLDVEGDEFGERIESDETAVEIVTIHASKGLAYDIVFAPYLEYSPPTKNKTFSYTKDAEKCFSLREKGNKYERSKENIEIQELANEQDSIEHRRLIYVAITRAKYKVYIVEKEKNPDVGEFIERLKTTGTDLYNIKRLDDIKECRGNFQKAKKGESYHKTLGRYLPQVSFTKSFSSLNAVSHKPLLVERKDNDGYDKFIFGTIGKGATLGTFLHEIYENIDFTTPKHWKYAIEKRGRKNPTVFKEDALPQYLQLITHTTHADLKTGFTLKDIPLEKRLTELEFYFNMQGKTSVIEDFLQEHGYPEMKINTADVDGAIMGFIDLLFEHEGKFYILDWKSNHIGNDIASYDESGVESAMTHANYHLQYLLYGVATKRFLESKGLVFADVFGGVIYLFLRGLRDGESTGVFYKSASECVSVIEGLDERLK